MSSSELRYLIAASTLAEGGAAVKQKDIAGKLGVSKVSAYNAVERLREKGYIEKNERKIGLTERGREALNEYLTIIRSCAWCRLSSSCRCARSVRHSMLQ